jgi:hypothetical protein
MIRYEKKTWEKNFADDEIRKKNSREKICRWWESKKNSREKIYRWWHTKKTTVADEKRRKMFGDGQNIGWVRECLNILFVCKL